MSEVDEHLAALRAEGLTSEESAAVALLAACSPWVRRRLLAELTER